MKVEFEARPGYRVRFVSMEQLYLLFSFVSLSVPPLSVCVETKDHFSLSFLTKHHKRQETSIMEEEADKAERLWTASPSCAIHIPCVF